MTGEEVLNIKMVENDANAETIRDYFKCLLNTLWAEGEGFSGKRPFGNSGWEREIYDSLENAGIDDSYDLDELIFAAIEAL